MAVRTVTAAARPSCELPSGVFVGHRRKRRSPERTPADGRASRMGPHLEAVDEKQSVRFDDACDEAECTLLAKEVGVADKSGASVHRRFLRTMPRCSRSGRTCHRSGRRSSLQPPPRLPPASAAPPLPLPLRSLAAMLLLAHALSSMQPAASPSFHRHRVHQHRASADHTAGPGRVSRCSGTAPPLTLCRPQPLRSHA